MKKRIPYSYVIFYLERKYYHLIEKELVAEDDKAYIILMKSEEEGVERFVVGGFKDGSIISEYYVGRNDGSFEKVNEYFEVELIKGENMISISCDGISEDARIEIIYN